MPALRVGIAFGTVTTRMGDVFGTTVNLASRLTSIAPKDAVLVDGAFAKELVRHGDAPESEAQAAEAVAAAAERARVAEKEGREPDDEPPLPTYRFGLQPMWQRPVRGLGVVEPWLLARRGRPAPERGPPLRHTLCRRALAPVVTCPSPSRPVPAGTSCLGSVTVTLVNRPSMTGVQP